MTHPRRPHSPLFAWCLTLCAAGLTLSCDVPGAADDPIDDGTQSTDGQALSLMGNALLVVGNATLPASDSAIRQRLQGMGLSVVVKTGPAVTSADAVGRLVVISESVTSGDVNTKFTGTNSPVVSLEPLLFDDLAMTGSIAGNISTVTGQTSVQLLATPGTLAGNVTVAVTGSAQTFGYGRPAPSATVLATVAGDATRATIFAYERGASMFSLVAPGRRVGWFATATAVPALNSNGWSLFDAAINWAFAGLSVRTCMTNQECPGTLCEANRCGNTCQLGKTPGSNGCVDIACMVDSTCPGTLCQAGRCTSTCAPGKVRQGNACVVVACASAADCPGTTCVAGQCTATCVAGKVRQGDACVDQGCMVDADCPGTTCVANRCSSTCAGGQVLCGGACVDVNFDHNNCGMCGRACASTQMCVMATCH